MQQLSMMSMLQGPEYRLVNGICSKDVLVRYVRKHHDSNDAPHVLSRNSRNAVRNKNTLGRDTYKYPFLLRVGGGKLVFIPRGPGLVGTSEKGSVDTTRQRGSNPGESRCELK